MRTQRGQCYAIVRKTVIQNVVDGLTVKDWNELEEMLRDDMAASRVKHHVETQCELNIKQIQDRYMKNCGGREAYVVGIWADAAEKATIREIQKEINEFRRKNPSRSRSESMPTKVPRSKEDPPAGPSQSRRTSIPSSARQSKGGFEASCGRPKTTMAGGVKRKGLYHARGVGEFDDDDFVDSKTSRGLFAETKDFSKGGFEASCDRPKTTMAGGVKRKGLLHARGVGEFDDIDHDFVDSKTSRGLFSGTEDFSKGIPHVGPLSGVDRGLRLSTHRRAAGTSVARSSDIRLVQNGGVKKVKKSSGATPGTLSKFRTSGSSRDSSSFEAMQDELSKSKTPVKMKKEGTPPTTLSTTAASGKQQKKPKGVVGGRDRRDHVVQQIAIVHSSFSLPKGPPVVNLYKIAGHGLICNKANVMDVTCMTDEQYGQWSENFYDWAGAAACKSAEEVENVASLFMGLKIHGRQLSIWKANWEAIGGNVLDAHPRRPSEQLDGLDEPLDTPPNEEAGVKKTRQR
ncbi:hypothetical protein BSKO_12873 [Bryopsis sp. KO-2023]|nr:hypothetical protein BSKO_12873 [Bryopsis sp. KO-2023]